MKPISFPEVNLIFAKDQPQYIALPGYRSEDGIVVTCWGMTWRERLKVFLTGRVWFRTMTFGNPLYPQSMSVDKPLQ